MFDLSQLEVFSTAAKLKSFSAAARELYISQATVSMRIKS